MLSGVEIGVSENCLSRLDGLSDLGEQGSMCVSKGVPANDLESDVYG